MPSTVEVEVTVKDNSEEGKAGSSGGVGVSTGVSDDEGSDEGADDWARMREGEPEREHEHTREPELAFASDVNRAEVQLPSLEAGPYTGSRYKPVYEMENCKFKEKVISFVGT
jgi:hypothetical protein